MVHEIYFQNLQIKYNSQSPQEVGLSAFNSHRDAWENIQTESEGSF